MRTLLVNCYKEKPETRMPFYRAICERYSNVAEIVIAELKPGYNLNGVDAVIFSGSQWMLSEQEPQPEVVEFVRGLKLPTLGICFGHQLLARSFGAEVKKGNTLIERDEKIKVVSEWDIFFGLFPETTMRESHQEFVTPESIVKIGWEIGAISESCPVEAVRHPELPLFGVQFHPERSGESGARLFENFFLRVVRRQIV